MPEGDLDSQAEYLFGRLDEDDFAQTTYQLRQLPELRDGLSSDDIEALADIVALATKSSDEEIREAFGIMARGGIGNQLVSYGPYWNTQLQILFWLGQQNDFRINDKLALAVALTNGVWVAMGNDGVDQAVFADANEFLEFQRGYNPHVLDYPLEALIALSWRGNYSAMSGRPQHLPSFRYTSLPRWAYDWITVGSLERMREEVERKGWGASDPDTLLANLEWYFYFNRGGKASDSTHWKYSGGDEATTIEGRESVNHDTSNADYLFDLYVSEGYVVGDCGDETALLDALAKSWGVATLPVSYAVPHEGKTYRHFYNIYFDDKEEVWKAYPGQAGRQGYPSVLDSLDDFPIQIYVGRPPVVFSGFLSDTDYTRAGYQGRTVYRDDSYTMRSWEKLVARNGIPTRTIRAWILE